MALAGSVTGDGKLVTKQKNGRQYSVQEDNKLYTYRDVTNIETRRWGGLTETAATTALAAITTSSGESGAVDESDPGTINGYSFVKTTETKSTYIVSTSTIPDE